jgi:hypothetical protein
MTRRWECDVVVAEARVACPNLAEYLGDRVGPCHEVPLHGAAESLARRLVRRRTRRAGRSGLGLPWVWPGPAGTPVPGAQIAVCCCLDRLASAVHAKRGERAPQQYERARLGDITAARGAAAGAGRRNQPRRASTWTGSVAIKGPGPRRPKPSLRLTCALDARPATLAR